MTSTTLTLQEFSDKLQQAATHSITSEGIHISYEQETLFILTEDDRIAYIDIPEENETPVAPYYHHFDLQNDQEVKLLEESYIAYKALLSGEDEHKYREIELTFHNESGDHAGTAIVPIGFEYDASESLTVDGTGYHHDFNYNILG